MLQCYNGSWQTANQQAMQVMRGIGKKKKETQVKTANLQMRSWPLIILIRVKHSLYWSGYLNFHFTD